MAARRICFDRLLPRHLRRQLLSRTVGGRARAISPRGKQWLNGSTITIRFLGGSQKIREQVEGVAKQWTEYANLHFEFTTDPRAEIRVGFDEADGAWSYIGLDNKGIPLHATTLNLGWVDQGVILHEFGHMIGLAHEHQSPIGGIKWNESAVIADLSGPPNFWDEATIRHNVLDKYAIDHIHGTDFDPDSIMLYAFPAEWTTTGTSTHENNNLSDLDKLFVAGEKMYPKVTSPEDKHQVLQLDVPAAASIGSQGDEDFFRFEVERPGVYVLETAGSTDVVLSLFGPNSKTSLVDEDDDSGTGLNARVRAALVEGEYVARISHYSPTGTGEYTIKVKRG